MAPRFSLLILLTIFSLLSLSAESRPGHPFHPCNILIISTHSFSLHRQPDLVAVVATDLRPELLLPRHRFFLHRPGFAALDRPQQFEQFEKPHEQFPTLGFSSLKDRTKDILSVVVSLLFGAACGALTATTMYLIWSLFNHRNESYRSMDGFTFDDDDDNDDDDDIFNPKKKAYVAIPAAPAATTEKESA